MTERQQPIDRAEHVDDKKSGWHDDPMKTVRQDLLRRAPFAEHTARLFDANHSADSSVVYGLEGPWGSGKSSSGIALITAFLTGPDESRWRVASFTPWATSGTEALLEEFFAALGTVAPQAEGNRRLRERITAYADIARPLAAMISVVGCAIAEASRNRRRSVPKALERGSPHLSGAGADFMLQDGELVLQPEQH